MQFMAQALAQVLLVLAAQKDKKENKLNAKEVI